MDFPFKKKTLGYYNCIKQNGTSLSGYNYLKKELTDAIYMGSGAKYIFKGLNSIDNCMTASGWNGPTIYFENYTKPAKALAITIYLTDIDEQNRSKIFALGNTRMYVNCNGNYFYATNGTKSYSSNLSANEVLNCRVTLYIDLVNCKIYINGEDCTKELPYDSSYPGCNDMYLMFGDSGDMAKPFYGNLYNVTIFKELLNETEIKLLESNNNDFSMIYGLFLAECNGKYYNPNIVENDKFKELSISELNEDTFTQHGFDCIGNLYTNKINNKTFIETFNNFNIEMYDTV